MNLLDGVLYDHWTLFLKFDLSQLRNLGGDLTFPPRHGHRVHQRKADR